jgi:mersacidin/lichenicidin family type 2 lantibiotic
MSKINVVRAWKDAKFRQSLSAEEQAMLPANPVGRVELSDAQLSVSGAKGKETTNETLCTHPMFCTRLSCPTYLLCPVTKKP